MELASRVAGHFGKVADGGNDTEDKHNAGRDATMSRVSDCGCLSFCDRVECLRKELRAGRSSKVVDKYYGPDTSDAKDTDEYELDDPEGNQDTA